MINMKAMRDSFFCGPNKPPQSRKLLVLRKMVRESKKQEKQERQEKQEKQMR
jgi:hypothetical protein